jgi:hypothetical protein
MPDGKGSKELEQEMWGWREEQRKGIVMDGGGGYASEKNGPHILKEKWVE